MLHIRLLCANKNFLLTYLLNHLINWKVAYVLGVVALVLIHSKWLIQNWLL